MNRRLRVFLFLGVCLTTGCADSSDVRPVIQLSPGLDFQDAQRLANVECKKLDARSARMVNGKPDYTFECVEFESAAEKLPIESPAIGHGPLD